MDIISVLQDLHIPYKLGPEHRHVRHGWAGVDCPQCSPGMSKYKLGINLSSLAVTCWTCGRFRLDDALVKITGIHWQEIAKVVSQLRKGMPTYIPQVARSCAGKLSLPPGVGPLQPPHERYLSKRGFDPVEVTRLWGVQGIPLSSRLSWRLFLPIWLDGNVVSWTTRAIRKGEDPRYVSAKPEEEKVHHKHVLFGEDYVRHALVLVEGPLDAIKIGPGACALMGTTCTPEQRERILKYPVRVVCLDAQPAAQRKARELVNELAAWPGDTYNYVFTSGKDAASASQEDVQELRQRFLE